VVDGTGAPGRTADVKGNVRVPFDPHANGSDMLALAGECRRSHLQLMLRHADAGELASTYDQGTVDAVLPEVLAARATVIPRQCDTS
jgi:hypothetical protein